MESRNPMNNTEFSYSIIDGIAAENLLFLSTKRKIEEEKEEVETQRMEDEKTNEPIVHIAKKIKVEILYMEGNPSSLGAQSTLSKTHSVNERRSKEVPAAQPTVSSETTSPPPQAPSTTFSFGISKWEPLPLAVTLPYLRLFASHTFCGPYPVNQPPKFPLTS